MITPLLRIEVERQRLALQTQRLLAGFESQLEHSLGLEVRLVVVQPGPDTESRGEVWSEIVGKTQLKEVGVI